MHLEEPHTAAWGRRSIAARSLFRRGNAIEQRHYITMVGKNLHCAPEGKFIATISTTVEGDISGAVNELAPAIALVGGNDNIMERFDEVAPYFSPKEELEVDNCY